MKKTVTLIITIFLLILISFFEAKANGISTTGLVAEYRCENNVTDMSGTGNNGTWVGGSSYGSLHPNLGSACKFNASDSTYVNIPDSNTLDLTGAATICAWVNVSKMASRQVFISKMGAYLMEVYHDNSATNHTLGTGLYHSTSLNQSFGTANMLTPLNSTLFVCESWNKSVNSGQIRLYINGTQIGSYGRIDNKIIDINSSTGSLALGKSIITSGRAFGGMIDEVTIWNVDLLNTTIAQMKSDYDIGIRPGYAPTGPFYLDADADGSSTSCSSAAPCKSLQNLTELLTPTSADVIYPDSCDIFRGTYSLKSNMTSYGTCPGKARIWGSYNYSLESQWTNTAGNIWQSTASGLPNTANLLFYNTNRYAERQGDAILGYRETAHSALNNDYEYYYNSTSDSVFVYSSIGNPGTNWGGIEITNYENPSSDTIFYIHWTVAGITINNLEFAFANTQVIDALATANITITENHFEYTWEKTIEIRASNEPEKNNHIISFNTFNNTGLKGASHNGMPGSQGEGIFMYLTNDVSVLNNSFNMNYGCVINSVNTSNSDWIGNYINGSEYDSSLCAGFYPEASQDIEIAYNYVERDQMSCIYIGAEAISRRSNNITIHDNIFVCPTNKIQNLVSGPINSNISMTKNTFIRKNCNTTISSFFLYFKDFNDLTFQDNIIFNDCYSNVVTLYFNNTNTLNSDYNGWYQTGDPTFRPISGSDYASLSEFSLATGQDSHSYYENPYFSDYENGYYNPSLSSNLCTTSSTGSYIGALSCVYVPQTTPYNSVSNLVPLKTAKIDLDSIDTKIKDFFMYKVIFPEDMQIIKFNQLKFNNPIFIMRDGFIMGMYLWTLLLLIAIVAKLNRII